MGAKTMTLTYANGKPIKILKSIPVLDRTATQSQVNQLFSTKRWECVGDTTLEDTYPPNNEIRAASFPDLSIFSARDLGIDYPSSLPQHFLDAALGRTVYLHAMHSVVDWCAFAIWVGKLVRSLSLSPDSGIMEDIGERMPFELPFWNGDHSMPDDEDAAYPFPFHPLDMGGAALHAILGYQIEGLINPDDVQPRNTPLIRFAPAKPWWKVW